MKKKDLLKLTKAELIKFVWDNYTALRRANADGRSLAEQVIALEAMLEESKEETKFQQQKSKDAISKAEHFERELEYFVKRHAEMQEAGKDLKRKIEHISSHLIDAATGFARIKVEVGDYKATMKDLNQQHMRILAQSDGFGSEMLADLEKRATACRAVCCLADKFTMNVRTPMDRAMEIAMKQVKEG